MDSWKLGSGWGGYGLWNFIDKNRRYFYKGVHGDDINEYSRSKHIGDVRCLSGEWDDTEFNFFKDADYNITIISNFSGLTVPVPYMLDSLIMKTNSRCCLRSY